jgi:hypothetical protein
MPPEPMPHVSHSLILARNAVSCSVCFAGGELKRAGIRMAQPFTIGSEYELGGIAIVSINPGASSDGGYKEARLHALTRFAEGEDAVLPESIGLRSPKTHRVSGIHGTWPACVHLVSISLASQWAISRYAPLNTTSTRSRCCSSAGKLIRLVCSKPCSQES